MLTKRGQEQWPIYSADHPYGHLNPDLLVRQRIGNYVVVQIDLPKIGQERNSNLWLLAIYLKHLTAGCMQCLSDQNETEGGGHLIDY